MPERKEYVVPRISILVYIWNPRKNQCFSGEPEVFNTVKKDITRESLRKVNVAEGELRGWNTGIKKRWHLLDVSLQHMQIRYHIFFLSSQRFALSYIIISPPFLVKNTNTYTYTSIYNFLPLSQSFFSHPPHTQLRIGLTRRRMCALLYPLYRDEEFSRKSVISLLINNTIQKLFLKNLEVGVRDIIYELIQGVFFRDIWRFLRKSF